jgi:hypothetical protein
MIQSAPLPLAWRGSRAPNVQAARKASTSVPGCATAKAFGRCLSSGRIGRFPHLQVQRQHLRDPGREQMRGYRNVTFAHD